jgi:NAD(P)-dependent dehydrogenase (short-subunit alcohol dehydrogenase family)
VAEWGVQWDSPPIARRPDMSWADQGVPLGHRPNPHHYARAAVFLASDDAEMITACDLRVDGGTIGRYWRWNPGTTIE